MKNLLISIFLFLLKFAVALKFDSLTPHKISTIAGAGANSSLGFSVNSAGDVNGDGYEDVIMGAYGTGAAYVIYGGKTASFSDIDLSSMTLDPATTGFTVTGSTAFDYFGFSVSSAGDIDNDGYDDIVIGAVYTNFKRGAAYVIYGGPNSKLQNIDLSRTTLDPTVTGFTMTGSTAGDYFGYSVRGGGDINGDNYDDIIVSALAKNNYQGAAYVIYGGARSNLSNIDLLRKTLDPATTGFLITGKAVGDHFGSSVFSNSDIDNDGYDDMIIGAADANGYLGAAYVIYGGKKSSLQNIDLSSMVLDPAKTGFNVTIDGSSSALLGMSVASGDINGDGYEEIIIGATGSSNGQGVVYVIYGGARSKFTNIDLSSTPLDPRTTGFSITGNAVGDRLGRSVCARDVNGDGYDDIIAGAFQKSNNLGAAYVVYGGKKPVDVDLSSVALDPATTGLTILGNVTNGALGVSVSGADINNDGFTDLVIGAFRENNLEGSAYLLIYNQCPDNCAKCLFPSQCGACNRGFGLITSSECVACPENCDSCSSSTTCDICADGFMLSESLSCLDQSEAKAGEKAAAGALEGTSLLGSSLTSGSSLPFNFGLVAKILRNTKYLNLTVSSELQETFISWKVASGFMSAPENWNLKTGDTKSLPLVFSRYGLEPSFLINFWKPFIMSIIGLAVFLIFKGIEVALEKKGKDKNLKVYSISRQMNIAASNFALTQFYSNLDDVFFYFILDIRSTKFSNGFQILSCLLAVVLLIIGAIIIGFHVLVLSRYQKQKEPKAKLESFIDRNENISLFFKDFKDLTFSTQSFLLINIVRSTVSSLVFATLFEYPLLQILLLFALNIGMIIFILLKKPFKEIINTVGQVFCELVLFVANICVLILALLDAMSSDSIKTVEQLSRCIIVLNFILLFGCAIFLVVAMGKMFIQSYQERSKVSKKALSENIFDSAKFTRSGSQQSAQIFIGALNHQDSQNNSEFYNNNTWENPNNIQRGNVQHTPIDLLERSGIDSFEQSSPNIIFQPAQAEYFGDTSQSNLFSNNSFSINQQMMRQRGESMRTLEAFGTNNAYSNFQSPEIKGQRQELYPKNVDMSSLNLDSGQESTSPPGMLMNDSLNFVKKRKIRRDPTRMRK